MLKSLIVRYTQPLFLWSEAIQLSRLLIVHFFLVTFLLLLLPDKSLAVEISTNQPLAEKEGWVIGSLPEPISNNAVAAAKIDNRWQLFSFNGLESGKDWNAVSNLVMRFDLHSNQGFLIEPVPYESGRLASIAVTVNNQIYLFGGYTVAKNHEEKSTPEVFRFDPQTRKFDKVSSMPIPVDDSVAMVYLQRYIYLVSGWHDDGNVSNVQIFDTLTGKWFRGTPFPGDPVFGHSAGIVGNQLVVVDGVKVAAVVDGKRQYQIASQAYIGMIDEKDITKIDWKKLPPHPGNASYRMASVGSERLQKVVFAGGSANPYNYNGIGYNGVPSQPQTLMFAWDIKQSGWQLLPPMNTATMDHRGLLEVENKFYIVGGMLAKQTVSNAIIQLPNLTP